MRKLKMFNRITLDGFFAGPKGEIDWFVHDPKVDAANREIIQADTVLFGSTTFTLFKNTWPPFANDPNAPELMRMTAQKLNEMRKIVFSRSLKEPDWENTELHDSNLVEKVKQLKTGEGADIVIFGSGTIVQQLANEDLIDEYLFCMTPCVLGEGKPLFKNVKQLKLELSSSKSFESGNALLHYKRKAE